MLAKAKLQRNYVNTLLDLVWNVIWVLPWVWGSPLLLCYAKTSSDDMPGSHALLPCTFVSPREQQPAWFWVIVARTWVTALITCIVSWQKINDLRLNLEVKDLIWLEARRLQSLCSFYFFSLYIKNVSYKCQCNATRKCTVGMALPWLDDYPVSPAPLDTTWWATAQIIAMPVAMKIKTNIKL